ncbi:Hypothetical protein CINCED_3A005425 [Cinara cedri]|uniref:Uncharacterized protein n=1 Tax=Cinara cedri TaxID=506608 RepID=A0A5E4MSZ2_9HEMI|nr:Hypothetical protein CINCED_3A005425 [Cinara cedri]
MMRCTQTSNHQQYRTTSWTYRQVSSAIYAKQAAHDISDCVSVADSNVIVPTTS